MKCSSHIISNGIAMGKAKFLSVVNQKQDPIETQDQTQLFYLSIASVSSDLEEQIKNAKEDFGDRISDIFLAHQYIVKDPVLIQSTLDLIQAGFSAKIAYEKAVDSILLDFHQIQNEYMLGRIVDVLDATDKVKVRLNSILEEVVSKEPEDTIIVLGNLKPSIIFDLRHSHTKGFISKEGLYTQHSGIIAREIKIPGVVCPEIVEQIQENDYLIIDADQGLIFINPDTDTINHYQKEGAHEL
ncbi:MAG: hypothetical protein JXL85_07910 [Bacilli bacterium]|nr:hypothetical protein [Bacilli bacterium]